MGVQRKYIFNGIVLIEDIYDIWKRVKSKNYDMNE